MSTVLSPLRTIVAILPPGRVPLGYLVPLVILYRRLLFEGHAWLDLDFLISYRPHYEFLQASLAAGAVPVWTDSILGGFPIAFSEFGWFYPVTWVFLRILPMPLAYHAETAFGLLLAALAAYALGRAWGLDRLPAFVAGYLYGFGPFVFATSLFLNFADVFFVLPAAILAIERIAQGRRAYIVPLTLVVAVNVLAGHPHIAILLALAATIYGACRVVWTFRDQGVLPALRLLALLTAAAGLGLSIGAVRLLPLLVITEESTRSGGLDYGVAAAGAIHPLQLLFGYVYPAFDLPRVFGGVLRAEPLAYLGLLTPPLVIAALAWRWHQRAIVFLAVLLAGSWLLALGDFTPAFRALHALPLFGFFRAPSRFILLAGFSLAFLSAFGLQSLLATRPAPPPITRWLPRAFVLYAAVLAGALILMTLFLELNIGPLRDFLNRGIDRFLVGGRGAYATPMEWQGVFAAARQRLEQAFTVLSWTPVFTIAIALAAALAWRRIASGRWTASRAAPLLAAILVLDVTLSMGHGIDSVSAADWRVPVQSAAYLQTRPSTALFSFRGLADKWELSMTGRDELLSPADRDHLEFLFLREVLTPNLPLRSGLRTIDGYENLMTLRQTEVLSYLGSERSPIRGYAVSATESEESKAATLRDRLPVFAALNVGAILSGTNLDATLGAPALTLEVPIPEEFEASQKVWIYQVPDPLGDYYFATAWQIADPAAATDEILDRLARSPPGTVFLDSDPGIREVPENVVLSIQVVEGVPGRHYLRVITETPAILVLNRAGLPGWSVKVNDYPFELLTANRFAVAVAVPAGESKIVFSYAPPLFDTGVQLSLAGLAVLIGLTVFFYRRSRPGQPAGVSGNESPASP